MMGHTSGPWIVELRGVHEWQGTTIRPESETYALASFHGLPSAFGEPFYDADANARLCAAAPELLRACKMALAALEAFADSIDDKCGNDGCMCTMPGGRPHSQTYRDNEIATCQAAIAKAEGREP